MAKLAVQLRNGINMYKVLIPKEWIASENRLILRILNRNTRESKSHRIIAGREFPLSSLHFPAGNSSDFVIWVDQIHEGKSISVTERTNAKTISQVSSLRIYLDQMYKSLRPIQVNKMQELLKIINSLRWIHDPTQVDRIYRVSDNIFGIVSNAPASSVAELGNLIHALNLKHPANDGSAVMSNILYVYFSIRTHKVMNKNYSMSVDSLDSMRAGVNVAVPDEVRDILHEASSYGSHSSVNLLVACLESAFVTRAHSMSRIQEAIHGARQGSRSEILNTSGLGGAATYGPCDEDIGDAAIAPVALEYLHRSTRTAQGQEPTIIYSADPRFLRSYLTRLLFYIGLFPENKYHFHIIAIKKEAIAMKDIVLEHLKSILAIRESTNSSPNVDISFSECPIGVKEKVSYYASARYMIAGEIMKETSRPVWIQDVDLYPTGELASFIPTFMSHDVSLYRSNFLGGALPWVRYLGGNVFVSPTKAGTEFLTHVDYYMRNWLIAESSWMIDQNAISYALESMNNPLRLADTRTMRVPVQQSALANRIENMR